MDLSRESLGLLRSVFLKRSGRVLFGLGPLLLLPARLGFVGLFGGLVLGPVAVQEVLQSFLERVAPLLLEGLYGLVFFFQNQLQVQQPLLNLSLLPLERGVVAGGLPFAIELFNMVENLPGKSLDGLHFGGKD